MTEMMQLVEKIEARLRVIYESNLRLIHDAKIGHQATTDESIESCKSSSEDKGGKLYGCIGVYDSNPHVDQLWVTVCAIIQQVHKTMRHPLHICGTY